MINKHLLLLLLFQINRWETKKRVSISESVIKKYFVHFNDGIDAIKILAQGWHLLYSYYFFCVTLFYEVDHSDIVGNSKFGISNYSFQNISNHIESQI